MLSLATANACMYPDFSDLVETLVKDAGEEGKARLICGHPRENLPGWNLGILAMSRRVGWILGARLIAGDGVATWAPPEDPDVSKWLDATHKYENWNPIYIHMSWEADAGFQKIPSVDARRLTCSLRAACVGAGVQFF